MHFHLEIIMPPTTDVKKAVEEILKPFDENGSDEDGERNNHAFWDYWIIGGRWAGAKLQATIDPEKMKAFYEALNEKKITVSGLQCGKQELQPKAQIPFVDALWNEFFPDSPVKVCPIFNHYHDQYDNEGGSYGDIMPLKDMPKNLTASHVIIASQKYDGKGIEAVYMMKEDSWNGVTHQKSTWDGNVKSAIEDHLDRLKNYRAEYAEKITPKDDWIVVTVDYHS